MINSQSMSTEQMKINKEHVLEVCNLTKTIDESLGSLMISQKEHNYHE